MDTEKILITGSSGYVASDLVVRLNDQASIFGVDKISSEHNHINASIESKIFENYLNQFEGEELIIINLAAARFDFGATAMDYYKQNVECHQIFTQALNKIKIKKFIHVSSVAALDGQKIAFSESLNCDDAYRSTKYLQELTIQKWCDANNIELIILYPSAIFSDDPRSDTNIGKLQSISKFLPFVPKINVTKSLTYLPSFSRFIIDSVFGKIPAGKYLTIEKPSLTVSNMIQIISNRPIKQISIPFLQIILKIFAYCFFILGFFGRIDLKLTPNRVKKLFTDTSYSKVESADLDTESYTIRSHGQLPKVLANFKRYNK